MLLSLIILILLFLIALTAFFFLASSLWIELINFGKPTAPFVPLPHDAVQEIAKHIKLDPTSVVYDLGCGDGRILAALHTVEPGATYVGIEYGWWPYVIARVRNRKIISPTFRIMRRNFFKEDFSQATVVTTYLFPKLMTALWPKLLRELPKGARLYSVDFKPTGTEPVKSIDLNADERPLGRTLFVYQF